MTSRGSQGRPGTTDASVGLVALLGVALCAFSYAVYNPFDAARGYFPGAPYGRDFVNFWIGGRLANAGRLDLLFDLGGYGALIRETFARGQDDGFVFSYPPSILPLLSPFGALPFQAALALWSMINLACFAWACRCMSPERGDWVLALLSPAVLMTLIYGHFGGVAALAVVILLQQGATAPWRAAALLAVLSVKPQLFAALALLALLAGLWPVVWRAALAAATLALLSVCFYGLEPWARYVAWTLPFHAALLAQFPVLAFRTTISAFAGLRMLGLPSGVADAAQIVVSLVALGLVALRLRRASEGEERALAFALGALVILPYANHYDLAIAAPAMVWLLRRRPILGASLWLPPAIAPVAGVLSLPVAPAAFVGAALLVLAGRAPADRLRPADPAAAPA